MPSNPKQTVVITGASRGIGLSFARLYLQQGYSVHALCRKASNELQQLTNNADLHIIEGIDVSQAECIEAIKSGMGETPVDLLINNAGILRDEVLGKLDYQQIQEQFDTNALGPLRVTEALLNTIKDGGKIALIASRMGSIEDNTSGGRYGYRMSKVALNIAGVSLAHDLASRKIAVGIYHPGLVGTEMIGGYGDITPDQAAERLYQRIEALNMNNSGCFYHSNGEQLPW